MPEELEYKGLWWLPDRPDKQIPGQLSLSENREATLELQGSLKEEPTWGTGFNPTLILGLSNSGKEIALHGCYLTLSTHSFSGFPTSQFLVINVFVGAHFQTEGDIRFKGLSIRYAHLDEWVNKSDISVEHGPDAGKFLIRYEQSEPIKVNVADYRIAVGTSWSMNEGHTQLKVTQKAWIELSSEQEKLFDEYLHFLYHIQNFLSLGMGAQTYPLEIKGRTEASKEKWEDGNELYRPVDIYYRIAEWKTETKTIHSFDMPFTLTSVQDRLETYLSNWIGKADVLKPVYDLFFATRFNPHLYLESTFLGFAQAIETYHRRRFDGKYQPDDDYRQDLLRKFVEVIPQDVDKGFRQSLVEGKLKFANEYSLRKRLLELADRIAPNVPVGFLASKKWTREFISKVCDTRNYLTHYNPELQRRAATQASELGKVTRQLGVLVEICLLEETGFGFDAIREIISNRRRYKYLLQ